MGASRRSIEFTCHAPLHANGDAIDFCIFVQRRSELIFTVLIGRRWWSTNKTVSKCQSSNSSGRLFSHLWEWRPDPWMLRAKSLRWQRMWWHLVLLEHMDVWASKIGICKKIHTRMVSDLNSRYPITTIEARLAAMGRRRKAKNTQFSPNQAAEAKCEEESEIYVEFSRAGSYEWKKSAQLSKSSSHRRLPSIWRSRWYNIASVARTRDEFCKFSVQSFISTTEFFFSIHNYWEFLKFCSSDTHG